APPELGPDVDLEMRALLDADHRAEHDHPDEKEARQLLAPDVARDQMRVARDDLQRDRNDQDRDGRHHQPGQESAIAVDQLSHAGEVKPNPMYQRVARIERSEMREISLPLRISLRSIRATCSGDAICAAAPRGARAI